MPTWLSIRMQLDGCLTLPAKWRGPLDLQLSKSPKQLQTQEVMAVYVGMLLPIQVQQLSTQQVVPLQVTEGLINLTFPAGTLTASATKHN